MFKRFLLVFLFILGTLFAEENRSLTFDESVKIDTLKQHINAINESVKDNLWYQRYENHLTYQKLVEELSDIDAQVKKLQNAKDKISAEKYEKLLLKQESLEDRKSVV